MKFGTRMVGALVPLMSSASSSLCRLGDDAVMFKIGVGSHMCRRTQPGALQHPEGGPCCSPMRWKHAPMLHAAASSSAGCANRLQVAQMRLGGAAGWRLLLAAEMDGGRNALETGAAKQVEQRLPLRHQHWRHQQHVAEAGAGSHGCKRNSCTQ